MTVLINVQPTELLESLIDKERLRQRLANLEAERRSREADEEKASDD